ncbi:hypothetical protein BH11GEM2_BH11GEM2_04870 [soil metagenome]
MSDRLDMHAFLETHPVFTCGDLGRFLGADEPCSQLVHNRLYYHTRRGRIVAAGAGVYASIPPGSDPASYPVDPYLVAARTAPDTILALHTALELHGVAYSLFNVSACYTDVRRRTWTWRGVTYRTLPHPAALRQTGSTHVGTVVMDRAGMPVTVTTLERTLVDTLRMPEHSGGIEEVWRSLSAVQYLNVEALADYVERLGSATTAARVGFFLEQHQAAMGVPDDTLERLAAMRPQGIHYFSRGVRRGGELRKRWHLIVPTALIRQEWEEFAAMHAGGSSWAEHGQVGSGTHSGEEA